MLIVYSFRPVISSKKDVINDSCAIENSYHCLMSAVCTSANALSLAVCSRFLKLGGTVSLPVGAGVSREYPGPAPLVTELCRLASQTPTQAERGRGGRQTACTRGCHAAQHDGRHGYGMHVRDAHLSTTEAV